MIQMSQEPLFKTLQYFEVLFQDFALDTIQMAVTGLVHILELCWCHPGFLFELGGKVGCTAVIHLKGNFRQRQFIVKEQLLHLFYFLPGNILFNGDAFHR